ncbi:glycosyltransferase family 4 protein [Flammeovirga sp. EKP202]|uniref:glycosyltransferase family 4 protein n=1 Tax=Flammeovirga sp. EKP202 TaxID=2770592 RepID=UPI00166002A0|nr:glycosyltransferase family 4 protein [Flammeovirga sp. EKP202]MBD0400826.1 glycosyltransferase family 4 protein [Flammeovirga sp. EKP202]
MSKKKVTYIISNIEKAFEFEWVGTYLNRDLYELNFILLNPKKDTFLANHMKSEGRQVNEIHYSSKKDLLTCFFKILGLLLKSRPNIIHTHLPEATLIGLLVGKVIGIKSRIYTRHHSTFNYDYHPHAIKYDLFSNWLATDIVAITQNVKKILTDRENVENNKVKVIPHCIDIERFDRVTEEEINGLKSKYNIKSSSRFVVGVISRYTEWKGIQYIIPAFKKLLQDEPNALLILAGGKGGEYTNELKALLKELPSDNYLEIEFENNLFALYKLFDVFVHTPIDEYCEAFGQIYIETMAANVPSIVTRSGIGVDILKDKENALVVDYKNSEEIYNALQCLLVEDKGLKKQIITEANQMVRKEFYLKKKIDLLETLYERS